MDAGKGAPDLQSILATLAQFNTPAPSSEHARDGIEGSPTPPVDLEALRPAPSTSAKETRLKPQSRSINASPRPMIDPASITVWPEALRCVTKIAAQNAQFAISIKRMIKEQRENEMRWYRERQSLKQVQANRTASAAKAQSILKSLNTSFYGSPPEVEDAETKVENELADFDRKIYAAQQAMETAMTAELKGLGVPFFGTKSDLVVDDGYDLSKEQVPESQPKWSPRVTESQLMQLRRRMVSHLEDLFKD